ncbi:calcium-binding protein [Phaeobacter marinintestinus]|uniref:calcium-binding protein n=1 Tax=Falsiphaeobacter marinintestinus TaxID=1492905 RepID=UPI001644DFAE|nr:calcium-binding protein [Phaeobacter marinintestinus]
MAVLSIHSVLLGTSAEPVGVLSDLDVGVSADGSTVLYATSREGLSISAFDLDAVNTPLLDWQSLPGGLSPLGSYGLELIDFGSGLQAVTMAAAAGGLPAFTLEADGCLPTAITYLDDAGGSGEAVALAAVTSGDTQYVYAVGNGGDMLNRYVADPTQALAAEGGSPITLPGGASGITAMISGTIDDQAYLFAADGTGDRVGVYKVKTNGELKQIDEIGAAEGLGIDAPSALTMVELGGQSFLILAARGSSSLSVLLVAADGSLSATDHLVDDLTSRFQNVTALDAVMVDGRAYVTAGGADDGVSLFELLPGGRLRLLDSVEDGLTSSLQNISGLAMAAGKDGVEIYAGSATEAGATRITVDLDAGQVLKASAATSMVQGGSGDDLLSDSAGNDDLRGGGGDDVISGGQGADWLEGGAGADTFVLSADGQKDRIRDFNPNEDRLDLSFWPMLRSTAQLTVISLSDGAEIAFGNESLRIYSSSGDALSVTQVLNAITGGFLHFDVTWIGAEDDTLLGTDGDDILLGGSGDDTLTGEGGDDRLEGGAGDDDLSGGTGADELDGGDGADSLIGGDGDDTLRGDAGDDDLEGGGGADLLDGGDGADTLRGNGGRDKLFGRGGNDVLEGGDGDDGLIGGGGDDRLAGGDGNDKLSAGAGADLLTGGEGDDVLRGRSGADTMQGDDGNDRLYGNGGADWLEGGANEDVLDGGGGADTLKGGGGADLLSGQNGKDDLQGEGGADLLHGGAGDDTLDGGGGSDTLDGGGGADTLDGGGGDDALQGNGGPDHLEGGAGDDDLTGGQGADTFLFTEGQDVITDFQNDIDTIELDDALWGGGRTVEQVLDLARVTNGDLVFDFGDGNILRIIGVRNPDTLSDDLVIV